MGKSERRGSSTFLLRDERKKRIRQTSNQGGAVQLKQVGVPANSSSIISNNSNNKDAPKHVVAAYGAMEGEDTKKRKDATTTAIKLPKSPKLGVDDLDIETSYYELVRKNRPFRLYLISYICNHVGEWLTYLASITAIEEIQLSAHAGGGGGGGQQLLTKTSRTAISWLIVIRLTPNVLLSPFGGVLADGMDRRKLMIALDMVGAMVALLFIVAVNQKSIALVYVCTFLQECVAGIYEPSRSAIIPLLVPEEEELKKATTMAQLAWSVVAAFGSAAGGFLVSMLGIRSCYFIDSLTYMVSAYLMTLVGGKWNVSSETTESPWVQLRGMVWDGVQYLRQSFFGSLVFLKFSAALVYGSMDVLNVSFSERGDLAGRSTRLGLLFASVGIGCLVGPLLAERYTDMSQPRTLQLACLHSILLVALGSLFMGLVGPFSLTCLLSGVRSMGQSIIWIDSSLLLQKFTDPEMLGRVSATDYALALLAESFSAVAAGVLQDVVLLSAEVVSFILGTFGVLIAAVWYIFHYYGGGAANYIEVESSTDLPNTEVTALMENIP